MTRAHLSRGLGALVLLALLAAQPAPASAATKPAGIGSGARAHPGGELVVGGTLRGGRGRATVRVALAGSGSPLRLGTVRMRLVRHGRTRFRTRVRVPAATPPGTYRVRACTGAKVCATARANVTVSAEATGSDALIASELAAGRLTPDQALVYRTYAAFGDSRLPARLTGDASVPAEDSVARQLVAAWRHLPRRTRRTLRPFLLPPPARGSWTAARRSGRGARSAAADAGGACDSDQLRDDDERQFVSVEAAGGRVRVWYPRGEARLETAARQMVPGIAMSYGRFKALFKRDLPSDAGSPCYHGVDGATDIYLVPATSAGGQEALALTIPSAQRDGYEPCSSTSSYIVASVKRGPPNRWVLAHELFHAFQNTFVYRGACASYLEFDEGLANWGANLAFPADDQEHEYHAFLTSPWLSLTTASYHGWSFDLYLEKVLGARTIPAIYRAYASQPDAGSALNAAIPGGLRKRYPEFAKYAWNQAPVAPSLLAWDRVAEVPLDAGGAPLREQHLLLAGAAKREAQVPVALEPLARDYQRYSVVDARVRKLTFVNRVAANPDASVQALLTLRDGTQRIEDWTGRDQVELCRDRSAEDVTGLVLIWANTSFNPHRGRLTAKPAATIELRDSCDELPYRYQVLGASIHTTATVHDVFGSEICHANGYSVKATTTLDADSAAVAADPSNAIVRSPATGQLFGAVGVAVPTSTDRTFEGCTWQDGTAASCRAHAVGEPGLWRIGFGVQADSKEVANATLRWTVPTASAGWVLPGGPNAVCHALPAAREVAPAHLERTEPMSKLAARGAQTFQLEGDELWPDDGLGHQIDFSYHYTLSITVRRVDENGDPV
jgi:hypothetical protein